MQGVRRIILCLVMATGCEASLGDGEGGAGPDGNVEAPPADASPDPEADARLPVPQPDGNPGPDAAPPCDDGDVQVVGTNGHCYMLFSSAVADWDGAVSVCALAGAYLATSLDATEDGLLNSLAGAADAWIGGTDAASEATWLWENGDAMPYTNWGSGEPNDAGTNGEDCMIIRREGTDADPTYNVGTWDDRPCSRMYNFICER